MSVIADLPDIRPSLLLDFANSGRVDPRIQCIRASAATCCGPDGKLRTVAANVPRIDYDPVTGKCLGLLVEEARTNLWLNSATASAGQSFTVTAQMYTLSFEGGGQVTLSGTFAGDTSTGAPLGLRRSLTFTPAGGTLTATPTGDVRNVQLEAGGFATSYIPTASATATRAADAITMEPPAGAMSGEAGAIQCVFRHYNGNVADTTILCIDDGTETQTNQQTVRTSASGTTIRYTPRSEGVSRADIGVINAPLGTKISVIGRFGFASYSAAANGSLAGPVNTGALVPQGLKRIRFGQRGSLNAVRMTGYFSKLALYAGAVTDAQLARMSQL